MVEEIADLERAVLELKRLERANRSTRKLLKALPRLCQLEKALHHLLTQLPAAAQPYAERFCDQHLGYVPHGGLGRFHFFAALMRRG